MQLAAYLEQRDTLIRDAAPGTDPARRLAHLTDEMLVTLARDAEALVPAKSRWALLALGGYGAGALLPASDLDLLVITESSPGTFKAFIEAILYPLWDAGLKVGHQVRSSRDQTRAVREELATLTASLTGRVLTGDTALGAEALATCARDARKRAKDVLAAMRTRPRPGSPYLLEPDLKEGAGGRRDFDELTWICAVLSASPQPNPDALVELKVLSLDELSQVREAAETVTAARWELQALTGGHLMSLDLAEEMRLDPGHVQHALAVTYHILDSARARAAGTPEGRHGAVTAPEVFALAQQGESGAMELERLAWRGDLEHLVPGIANLMPLRRPGLAHTLTVGAHCLKAASVISRIGVDIDAGPVATRSAQTVPDPRIPITAALVHDVGKRIPGPGHAERGESEARATASLLGLNEAASETVGLLVRHHLLLIETATRCDLDDEDAMLSAAGVLGNPELLSPLHLLTIADSLATGPGAWNEWTAALIGKLVTRLDAALSADVDGAGVSAAAQTTRAVALSGLPDQAINERAFIRDAPLRYLAGREPAVVLEHAALVGRLVEERAPGAHAIRIDMGPLEDTYLLTVATRDRHGLLATLAGVMALAGFDILAVEAIGTNSGIALDTFTVRSATLAPISTANWSRLERLMDAALRDRLAIGVRLSERRQHYRASSTGIDRVQVLANDDPYAAVVRIRATDRAGLLYDIARAMAESGLEIRSMTATTRHATADDVFRVTDSNGAVPEEGLLGMLRMRLREIG